MNPVVIQEIVLAFAGLVSLAHILSGGSSPLANYLLAWACFHSSEYFCTSRYSPRTLSPYSFLMWGARGSIQLAAVHLVGVCEYVLTQKYWHYHGSPTWGVAVAVAGIMVRAWAIHDCGDSFSHYIETDSPRKLVTSGIYSWCRHPSYSGFLVYVVGMQIILGNVVVHVISVAVLCYFFTQRIKVEEHFLVERFYGREYLDYRARVRAMVPYVY